MNFACEGKATIYFLFIYLLEFQIFSQLLLIIYFSLFLEATFLLPFKSKDHEVEQYTFENEGEKDEKCFNTIFFFCSHFSWGHRQEDLIFGFLSSCFCIILFSGGAGILFVKKWNKNCGNWSYKWLLDLLVFKEESSMPQSFCLHNSTNSAPPNSLGGPVTNFKSILRVSSCRHKEHPNLQIIFVRVYSKQTGDICWGTRSQMFLRITISFLQKLRRGHEEY